MPFDAIISGYVSMDRVVKIGEPARIGFTSLVTNKENAAVTYGGCSANVAFLLARLGKRALPLLRLGGDDTEELGFLEHIRRAGVCLDGITMIENETTSNCYLILDKNRDHITIFYPGAMDGKYAAPPDRELFRASRYGVLTVGSQEDSREFVAACRETETPLVFGMKSDFNAFPPPLLREILLYSEVIFTNEAERTEIERMFSLKSIADLFHTGRARIIVTTLGKRGSLYYEKSGDAILTGSVAAAEEGPVVDTTGSGDAYIAGFLYGLLEGLPVGDCCRHGSVLSSFIIENIGCITNAPDRDTFRERYARLAEGLA